MGKSTQENPPGKSRQNLPKFIRQIPDTFLQRGRAPRVVLQNIKRQAKIDASPIPIASVRIKCLCINRSLRTSCGQLRWLVPGSAILNLEGGASADASEPCRASSLHTRMASLWTLKLSLCPYACTSAYTSSTPRYGSGPKCRLEAPPLHPSLSRPLPEPCKKSQGEWGEEGRRGWGGKGFGLREGPSNCNGGWGRPPKHQLGPDPHLGGSQTQTTQPPHGSESQKRPLDCMLFPHLPVVDKFLRS